MSVLDSYVNTSWSGPDLGEAANDTEDTPAYLGYIGASVAVLCYGSNFIPVKKFETGDGMFFQLILCTAILVVGIIVNIIREAPKFYPVVMVGGAIWATGNICVVPIIKTIGMGLGLCIWGCTSLVAGWASGRFGMFGFIDPEIPSNETLNYVGVAMAVLSTSVYLFVRSEVSTSVEVTVDPPDIPEKSNGTDPSPSKQPDGSINSIRLPDEPSGDQNKNGDLQQGQSFLDRMSPTLKRIVGSVLSLISGITYGINFAPAIHVQDQVEGSSQNGLDYVFAHFTGIFITSVFYFAIYAAFMKNAPLVYPKVILPGLLSGLMWGVATTCWFVANKALSEPVAYPIINTGPAVIASLWGILVFGEIRGKRNIILLVVAFCLTVVCTVLSGLSNAG